MAKGRAQADRWAVGYELAVRERRCHPRRDIRTQILGLSGMLEYSHQNPEDLPHLLLGFLMHGVQFQGEADAVSKPFQVEIRELTIGRSSRVAATSATSAAVFATSGIGVLDILL